jgi:hypothetical protein
MKNVKTLVFVSLLTSACSSAPSSVIDLRHIGEEETIQTYGKDDGLKKAPPFIVDSGFVVSTGFVTIPADGNRPEAGVTMAQMQARAELAKAVETKIENFAQLASEGLATDGAQLRSIATETAKLTANDLRPRKTYYEKVKVISDSGVPRTEYRVWAEVVCDEAMFKRHVMDAIRGQTGKMVYSKAFQESVDSNWKSVVSSNSANDSDAKPVASPNRDTASTKSESEGE